MEDQKFDKMMRNTAKNSAPTRTFAIKMRYRIWKKGIVLYFTGAQAKMHLAGATLVVVLFFGGGVGTYAYASPDVNIQHPLYSVKQGIESVEGGFAFSSEQKADFSMKKAMRRMDEAEILHKRLMESIEDGDTEGVQKTLEMMEEEMERSMNFAEGEFAPENAKNVVERMEERCGKIRERIQGLPPLENNRPRMLMLHDKLQNLDENTLEKMEQLRQARQMVMQARDGKQKRVMLNFMMPPPP